MSIYNVILWVIEFFNDIIIQPLLNFAVFKSLIYMVENKIVIKHN